jgi:hypothetical protein
MVTGPWCKIHAQIQVRPLPEPGFEVRITNYVDQVKFVDTHEHIIDFEPIKQSMPLDIMLLLHHYADDDIKSAGMSKPVFEMLMTDSLSVMEKWDIVEPYWEGSRNTAYNRTVLIAANDLFGISDINRNTVRDLSDKVALAYENPGWYDHVLKTRSNIEYAILDVGERRYASDMFRYVMRFDNFISVHSSKDIAGKPSGAGIRTLNDYVMTLKAAFDKAVKNGMVGIKSGLAYRRILHYESIDKSVAEHIFTRVLQSEEELPFDAVKPLQDFMMHQVIRLAREADLPMIIHTGLQAGDGNYITNSNPAHLTNLFLEYRDVRFCLYHGGYPYGGELSALAKNFRNVYIDMCWMYIISPSYSMRYLHEWLETVPANKIMAFGGDYHNVENIYGHAVIARQVISDVLIEKVGTGYISEVEAKNIANMIMRENALSFYRMTP